VIAWGVRARRTHAGAGEALAAAGAAFGAFALTSPYVFLSFAAARRDLEAERVHLALGHFGSSAGWSAPFYAHGWFALALGWAVGAAALLGAVGAVRRREPWALLLLAFLVPLLLVLCAAPLRADRYLIPAIPVGCVLAAAWLADVFKARVGEFTVRDALVVAALCLLADGARIAHVLRELGPDSRTLARAWIETNLPSGSLLVLEPYGPELPGPFRRLAAGVELDRERHGPEFWMQTIPLFQVEPERAAVYYDPALYASADAFVVSGSVRERYRAEPARFPVQCAFYDRLESRWREAARIRPATGDGPELVIYRNPAFDVPFSRRVVSAPHPTRMMLATGGADQEAVFYRNFGMNYLGFGHFAEAAEAFEIALTFPPGAGLDRNQLVRAWRFSRAHLPPAAR
jgi:hypothetical protein